MLRLRHDRPSEMSVARRGRAVVRRRGIILLVVLVVVSLLALLGATFSYRMRADLSAVQAESDRLQATLAAEAGIQRALLVLRTERTHFDQWYDNEEAFRQIIVWAPDKIGGATSLNQEVDEGDPAWRFSIIMPRPSAGLGDQTERWRYGVADEAGKLNLNIASRSQLIRLFEQLELEQVTPEELADAVLDWRDPDGRTREFGAELEYYQTLDPPYRPKNGPLESIEELLLIKGFNGRILYGEDQNRNGHLDVNEDDGEDGRFPWDNADGELDRGIYPFITVYSRDLNSANDNKPRLPINNGINLESLREQDPDYAEQIESEIRPEVFDFINEAVQAGHAFKSVAELLMDIEIRKTSADQGGAATGEGTAGGPGDRQGGGRDAGGRQGGGRDGGGRQTGGGRGNGATEGGGQGDMERPPSPEEFLRQVEERKNSRRQQARDPNEPPTVEDLRNDRPDLPDSAFEDPDAAGGTVGDAPTNEEPGDVSGEGDEAGAEGEAAGEVVKVIPTVVEAGDMPAIWDRLTADPQNVQYGLINVNTASRQVLMTLPGVTAEIADAIVSAREGVDSESKETPAWLVTNDVIEPELFAKIGPRITARSLQFTIESFGFADHVGTYKRLQVVVEMRGQVEQVLYWRDISSLGLGYPVHSEEDEWPYEVALNR